MHVLEAAGRCLYGPYGDRWREIRQDLKLNERTFRRMLNAGREIPEGVSKEVETMLRDRAQAIDQALEALGFFSEKYENIELGKSIAIDH